MWFIAACAGAVATSGRTAMPETNPLTVITTKQYGVLLCLSVYTGNSTSGNLLSESTSQGTGLSSNTDPAATSSSCRTPKTTDLTFSPLIWTNKYLPANQHRSDFNRTWTKYTHRRTTNELTFPPGFRQTVLVS
jgi:hypothetical protein